MNATAQMNKHLSALEDILQLSAADEEVKKPSDKMAAFKAAFDELDDAEKKDARKAMFHEDEDEDKKDAKYAKFPEDDEEKKDAGIEEEDEKDKKIASLTASLNKVSNYLTMEKARPMVEKMLSARHTAGYTAAEINQFQKELQAMDLSQIKSRYDLESKLYPNTAQDMISAPWQASSIPTGTLEEILDA